MSINATLFFQMFTFILFIIFTMKMVWPFIETALDERQKKIAEGLAAAERGKTELELAQKKITEQLREMKLQSAAVLERANTQANHLIEEAKLKAQEEGHRLILNAKAEIDQAMNRARQSLKQELVLLAIQGAEKILNKEIDAATNTQLLENLVKELDSNERG